jgi:subtilisin family serine protease
LDNEFRSARDDNGHGTHTLSTAAGNAGVPASIFGIDRGVVSGVAPRAHVIMYKVCGNEGCFQSDSVAAIDQAI